MNKTTKIVVINKNAMFLFGSLIELILISEQISSYLAPVIKDDLS